MARWIARFALLVVLLAVALAAIAWWLLRGSLPALDGELALDGLSAPVAVERDALGVVTIDAANEADAMRALGYVHAQERGFEMDLLRRAPAGELSALFGPVAIEVDRRNRVHRMRARATAGLARIAGARMPVLEAYAAGANAGREALRQRPWPYLLLRQAPQPWTPADSALVGYAMYFDLQDSTNSRELAWARLRPALPPALAALLSHDGSRWDAPLAGTVRGDAPLPAADAVDLRRLPAPATPYVPAHEPYAAAPARFDPRAAADLRAGSNNFAVAGALTGDGRAIVADDMHLGLRAPALWFRARLRWRDASVPGGVVEVSGFTLPGLPAVIVGSNGRVAWGFTNSYVDTADWQRLRPCAPPGTDAGGCTPVERHVETIAVAGGEPVALDVDETAWGPVLHREPGGTALALRWTAHLPGALDLGLADFASARSVDAALAIADRSATPTQNLVVGDAAGNVAWRLLGPLPRRAPGCDGTGISIPPDAAAATPAGAAPAAEDDASIAPANTCAPWPIATNASPLLRSPTATRLWTANNRVVDGAAQARLGDAGVAVGARAKQIRDALYVRERHDEASLLAIQLDDRALLVAPWHALLGETARTGGDAAPALRALADAAAAWDGRAGVDATGYRIARAWRIAVLARIVDGLTAPGRAALGDAAAIPDFPQLEGVAWPLLQQRPPHLLPRRFACATRKAGDGCDDARDGWTALMEDAAVEVRDDLAALGPLAGRTWGERNTSAICHPMAAAIPFGERLLCMPAQPLPGDGGMPRVQGPAFGASQRMVVAPGQEARGIAHMPGGQSGHPLSPFWGAGHDDWVQGRASPFLPGETRHRLQLAPPAR